MLSSRTLNTKYFNRTFCSCLLNVHCLLQKRGDSTTSKQEKKTELWVTLWLDIYEVPDGSRYQSLNDAATSTVFPHQKQAARIKVNETEGPSHSNDYTVAVHCTHEQGRISPPPTSHKENSRAMLFLNHDVLRFATFHHSVPIVSQKRVRNIFFPCHVCYFLLLNGVDSLLLLVNMS